MYGEEFNWGCCVAVERGVWRVRVVTGFSFEGSTGRIGTWTSRER